jgi:hypothetical protein
LPARKYRLRVASSLRRELYSVVDEHGAAYCEIVGGTPLTVRDPAGSELAELRSLEAFYVPRMETYELSRGGAKLRIERRRRQISMTSEAGEETLVTRAPLTREFVMKCSGARIGGLRRRRLRGRRAYDFELSGDVDPVPLLLAAVLIDRTRLLNWTDFFTGV